MADEATVRGDEGERDADTSTGLQLLAEFFEFVTEDAEPDAWEVDRDVWEIDPGVLVVEY